MRSVVIFLGVVFILVGFSVIGDPDIIYGFVEDSLDSHLFYLSAIVVRFVLGVIFLTAASQSKYPTIIGLLGLLSIIASFIFAVMGNEDFHEFMASVIPVVKTYARLSGLFAVALGGFIIFAFRQTRYRRLEVIKKSRK